MVFFAGRTVQKASSQLKPTPLVNNLRILIMQIEIISEDTGSSSVKKILKYYLSKLEDQILKMTIHIERYENPQGHQYHVRLNAILINGSPVKFNDIQKDIQKATQRTLDRLVRHLQFQRRRQDCLRQY